MQRCSITATLFILFAGWSIVQVFSEIIDGEADQCSRTEHCDACKYVKWLEHACDERTVKRLCSTSSAMTTATNHSIKNLVEETMCCPPGEKLDDKTLKCIKGSSTELIKEISNLINKTKAFTDLEKDAKNTFLENVKRIQVDLEREEDTAMSKIKEKMKNNLKSAKERDWLQFDDLCKNKTEQNKAVCDVYNQLKEKATKYIEGITGNTDHDCGPNQKFDLTILKCVDDKVLDIGMRILGELQREGSQSSEDELKDISKSFTDGMMLVLKAIKEKQGDLNILNTLKKESVAISHQIKNLCSNPDETKIPYCKMISDAAKWFDDVVNEKGQCKDNHQLFHEKMTRKEIQCLDLDFVGFIKAIIDSYLAEAKDEAKSLQKIIAEAVSDALNAYRNSTAVGISTTRQRQESFVKYLQNVVQDSMAKTPELCNQTGVKMEDSMCKFSTKVLSHLGKIANEQSSCAHGQIFDFGLLRCIDVMFADFILEILNSEILSLRPEDKGADIVKKLKGSLSNVMKSLKQQSEKFIASQLRQASLDAFIDVMKTEAKTVIEVLYPQCPLSNTTISTTTGMSAEQEIEQKACKMVHKVAQRYIKVLSDQGATSCPAGYIFDTKILKCVDMHVVEFANDILTMLKNRNETNSDRKEKYMVDNMISQLESFIAKVKEIGTGTSADKLQLVKEQGKQHMVGYLQVLNKICDEPSKYPLCPKALKLGEAMVGFLFDKMFTTGCGINEIFDLSILKCVNDEVYNAATNLISSVKAVNASSETGKIIQNNLADIMISFVGKVKAQARGEKAIDLFMAVGDTVRDQIMSIVKTADALCNEHTMEKEDNFVEFNLCMMVRKVTRQLAQISHGELLAQLDKETTTVLQLPEQPQCTNWDETVLNCLDIHVVGFLKKVLDKIGKEIPSMLDQGKLEGKLFKMLNILIESWVKMDQSKTSFKEIFEAMLSTARFEMEVFLRQMKGACDSIPDSKDYKMMKFLCASYADLAGNFGANLITKQKNTPCERGQILDMDLMKCVDVVFIGMIEKLMVEMKNETGASPGSMEHVLMSSIEKFMAGLLKESTRSDKSLQDKSSDFFNTIRNGMAEMMKTMTTFCAKQETNFDYKMCAMMTQMVGELSKANMILADGDLDEFLEAAQDVLKQEIDTEPSDIKIKRVALSKSVEDLKKYFDSIHAEELEKSGIVKRNIMENNKQAEIEKKVKLMCAYDPGTYICKKLSNIYDKYLSTVGQYCEKEFEMLNLTTMKCSHPNTLQIFFEDASQKLKNLPNIQDIQGAELKSSLTTLIDEVVPALKNEEGKKAYDEILKPFEQKWFQILEPSKRMCASTLQITGGAILQQVKTHSTDISTEKLMLCKIIFSIMTAVNKKLDDTEARSEKKMCSFIREKAGMKDCPDGKHYCVDTFSCIPEDSPCNIFTGKSKEKINQQTACEVMVGICKRDKHMIDEVKESCEIMRQKPVYINVPLKYGEKIKGQVLEKFGKSIDIERLELDGEVDLSQWEWNCDSTAAKTYLESLSTLRGRRSLETINLWDCAVRPKGDTKGDCSIRTVPLKGVIRQDKKPVLIKLMFGLTSYNKPANTEEIITKKIPMRDLFSKSVVAEFVEMKFNIPPLRVKCGETHNEFKKCETLDIFLVGCDGEGDIKIKFKDGKMHQVSCESFKQSTTRMIRQHIGMDASFSFTPKRESLKGGILKFAYACKPDMDEGGDERLVDPVVIDSSSISLLKFAVEAGRPQFKTGVEAYGKPVDIRDADKNTGFSVKELLEKDPTKYKAGKDFLKVEQETGLKESLAANIENLENPGILIETFQVGDNLGLFKFKCAKDTDFRSIMENVALSKDCRIKFEPRDNNRNWKENDVKFDMKIISNFTGLTAGSNTNNITDEKLSSDSRPVILLGLGCTGKIGEEIRDEGCGTCSKNKTVCGDCLEMNTKAYTLAIVKEKNKCCDGDWCPLERKCYMEGAPKDCDNAACGDAIKECGQCISGTPDEKRKRLSVLKDECQFCKSEKKTCSADGNRIEEISPRRLLASKSNRINVCFKSLTTNVQCHLKNEIGSCALTNIKPQDLIRDSNIMCNAKASRKQCLDLFVSGCAAGTYRLICNKTMEHAADIVVGSDITIHQDNVKLKPGMNNLKLTLSNISETVYKCCWKDNENEEECDERKLVQADMKFKCLLNSKKGETVSVYIKDCDGRKSNEVQLETECIDAEVVDIKYGERQGKQGFMITFDKIVQKSDDEACNPFIVISGKKWLTLENTRKLPKKCFKCNSGTTDEIELNIAEEEVTCVNVNEDSEIIMSCVGKKRYLNLFPTESYTHNASWSVEYANGFQGDATDLQTLKGKLTERTLPEKTLTLDGSLINKEREYEFVFTFTGKNKNGKVCTHDTNINIRPFGQEEEVNCEIKERDDALYVAVYDSCNRPKRVSSIAWRNQNETSIISKKPILQFSVIRNYVVQNLQLTASVITKEGKTCQPRTDVTLMPIKLDLLLENGRRRKMVDCASTAVKIRSNIEKRIENDQAVLVVDNVNRIYEDYVIVTFECSSKGGPCNDVSGVPLEFESNENGQLVFDATKLTCGNVYEFTKFMFIGDLFVSDKIGVITKDLTEEKPPEINCKKPAYVRKNNYYKIRCNIFNANVEDIVVENIFVEEGDAFDFDSSFLELEKKKTRGGVYLVVSVPQNAMVYNGQYRFLISVAKKAEVVSVIKTKSGPPRNCRFSIFPQSGEVHKDEFTLSVSGCVASGKSKIRYSAILEYARDVEGPKRLLKIKDISDDVVFKQLLSPSFRNDSKVFIKVYAKADGQMFSDELFVTVKPGNSSSQEVAERAIEDNNDRIANGDPNGAAANILNTFMFLESTNDQQTDKDEKEAVTDKLITMIASASEIEGADLSYLIYTMAVMVEKKSGVQVVTDEKKKAATKLLSVLGTKAPTFKKIEEQISKSSRKRRAIDNNNSSSTPSNVWMDTTLIEDTVKTHNSTLFPVLHGETDKIAKTTFLGFVPNAKRSLVKNSAEEDIVSINTVHITFMIEQAVTLNNTTVITLPHNSSFNFSKTLKDNYEEWTCSTDNDKCNGIYFAGVEVEGDILSNASSDAFTLVSHIVSLDFINPLDRSEYAIIDEPAVTSVVTLLLTDTSSKENIICHIWGGSSWINGGCQTSIVDDNVKCECPTSVGVYMGAFRTAVEYAIEVQNQYTTTPVPTTTTTTTTLNPPTTTTSVPIVEKLAQFKFIEDYNATVNSLGGEENARTVICLEVRYKLNLITSEFKNCTIKPGSIIVSFVIVQSESEQQETQQLLLNTVANNGFSVTGATLTTDSASTTIDGKTTTSVSSKESEDNMLIIIIVAAVVVVVIIVVIIIALVLAKSKKSQVSPKPKKLNDSSYPLEKDWKEKEANGPRQEAAINNPAFEDEYQHGSNDAQNDYENHDGF